MPGSGTAVRSSAELSWQGVPGRIGIYIWLQIWIFVGKDKDMEKDWTGNGKSIFTTLGASNHTDKEREINDYYATDPIAIDALLSGGGGTRP